MTYPGFPTAQAAEAAFYQAFEEADYEAMMAVWGREEDIECIHPLGERIMGVAAVSESWHRILSGNKGMQFRLSHTRRIQGERLMVHVLYENITIGDTLHPPVVATNIYRFNGTGWHMVLHHASPATEISGTAETPENPAADTTIH